MTKHGVLAVSHDGHTKLSWIFHFVDIIYVGAVYSIGQLFEQCGTNHKVFFMASSYMSIMFTTRYQFDQYASTFTSYKQDQEFLRVCLMILYCMAIYSMTLNIAFKTTVGEHDGAGYFGHCVRNVTYDNAFAASFLISRAAIVSMYFMQYKSEDYEKNDDFWKLFLRKLIPMVIGCGLMTMVFADVSPVIAYFTVAFVEVVSEFIGEVVVKFKDEKPPLMPDAEHLQERLGLFFMLILGETMVGTLFVFYDQKKIKRTYGSCIAAFILVASIGMQFFERAQADVDSPSNTYGDTYDEKYDFTRLPNYVPGDTRHSLAVRPSEAASSITVDAIRGSRATNLQYMPRPSEMATAGGDNDEHKEGAEATTGLVAGEYNHHPLKHKKKRYYAIYVVLHALASFFMLIATTGIIEIYYELEGFNPHACQEHSGSDDAAHAASEAHYYSTSAYMYYAAEEESHSHYFHLKAQVAGGLASVWFCMMLMEMLQPAYFNSLCANFFTSQLVDQRFSKILFFIKFCVIIAHLAMMAFPGSPGEGNYFIGYNAFIAAIPSLCDISKIVVEWNVSVNRINAELDYRGSKFRNTVSAPSAPAHPDGHASPASVKTLNPMSTSVN